MKFDDWQKYLESQFVDDAEFEQASFIETSAPKKTIAGGSDPGSKVESMSMQDPDNWIPAKSAFGVTGMMLSANVTAHSPKSCQQPDPHDGAVQSSANVALAAPQPRIGRRFRASCEPPIDPSMRLNGVSQPEIPMHLRVLLDLRSDTKQDDSEIAQSSYKRPFKETRQELIARLIDPVITLEEAARILNVCPTTVRRYTNRGLLSYYRKQVDRGDEVVSLDRETRQRRFRLSDILAFLKHQESVPVEL